MKGILNYHTLILILYFKCNIILLLNYVLPVTLNTRITVPLSLAVAIRVPDGENWIAASCPEWAGIMEVEAYIHFRYNYDKLIFKTNNLLHGLSFNERNTVLLPSSRHQIFVILRRWNVLDKPNNNDPNLSIGRIAHVYSVVFLV